MVKATAKVIQPPPPPATVLEKVTLELTGDEAKALVMLLGNCASEVYAPKNSENSHYCAIYSALTRSHESLNGLWYNKMTSGGQPCGGYVVVHDSKKSS